MSDIADSSFHQILLEPLNKQSSKLIKTFKLIFFLLDYLLLKPKTLRVPQVQYHLWSPWQVKRSTKPSTYLVFWLWTLRDLPCICQVPWATLPTNFPPMKQIPSCKQIVVTSTGCTCAEIKHNKVVVKKENNSDESNKKFPWHWSLDLLQQIILFREAMMSRRLMLVTPSTLI